MLTDLQILPALPADAGAILALRRSVLREGAWFTMEPDELREDVTQRAELIRHLQRSGNGVCLVAKVGGELAGTAMIEGGGLRRIRHVGRLEMMVAEPLRGLGVGDALLTAALRAARRNVALEKVELALYAHNLRAHALYVRHGFEEEGRRRRQQRLSDGEYADEVWMALWVRGGAG
ncbi:N-acetyltransferase [Deltaproteobacteria bacterium]|nr:N-acetyltransferase [Deltaproteobacteria bacterium]